MNPFYTIRIAFLLLGISSFSALFAQQQQYIFERLQGVYVQPTTYTMDLDEHGRLWYGTWGRGVFRYDGYDFKRYQKSPSDSNSLANDRILVLKTDRKQRVWVSTMNGLDCIDRKTGQIRHFQALGDSIFQFMSLYEDRRGQIWASGAKGVLRFQEKTQTFENVLPSSAKPPPARPNQFFEDSEGALWMGRADGLLRFSADRSRYEYIPIWRKDTENQPFRIISIAEDAEQNFWIAGYDGLMRFDRATRLTSHPPLPDSLAAGRIADLLRDPEGNIWMAVPEMGLYRWSPKTGTVQRFSHNVLDPTSLPSNQVHDLLYDSFGNLWAGTDKGLARLNLLPQPFSRWLLDASNPDLPANNIVQMAQDPLGGILVRTQGGMFYLDHWGGKARKLLPGKNHPPFFEPDDLVKDQEGNIWANYDGLYRWNPALLLFERLPLPLPATRLTAVAQDRDEPNIWWLGTLQGLYRMDLRSGSLRLFEQIAPAGQPRGIGKILDDGQGHIWLSAAAVLTRFDKKSHKIDLFSSKTPAPNQLANDEVLDLKLSPEGWIWVTTSSGLTRIDLATGHFHNLFLEHGLPDNLVLSALFDRDQNLWLVFPEHLLRRDAKTGVFRVWNTASMLQTGQLARRAGCLLNDGRLLIAAQSGLILVDPTQMGEVRGSSSILLTRFETNEKDWGKASALEFSKHFQLASGQNNLTLEWAGIQTARAGELRYECKLVRKGEKKDWEKKGLERQAVYANLDPGAYTFYVRIEGGEGPELSIDLAIAPAWWQAESFKMLLLALFATAAYLFWRNREDTRELLQQKELAEQNAHYKSRFLANMSHEIRTPMNAILGLSRLLTESELPPKQGEYAEAIRQSSENLLVIVNDVLDQMKIESGQFKFQHKPFDLELIVRHLQNTLGYKAGEKGLQFDINIAPEIQTRLVGDSVRLNQILTNLLGNAIKFTEKGGVTLKILPANGSSTDGVGEVMIGFQVRDTGIGIPEAQLSRVFESFQQADDDISANYGGTGLGLSITKDLVEQQGGKIMLESEQGRGTTITAFLTFELDTLAITAAQLPVQQKIVFENLRILLVEDTFFNQMLAMELLKSRIPGVVVEVAENGQVALEKIDTDAPFDLVLMDLKMPVMDGLEATRRLRAQEKWRKLPIIALTANAVQEELDKCRAVGMDAYVTKPIDTDELFATMRKVLG